jgi:hypothetical protein
MNPLRASIYEKTGAIAKPCRQGRVYRVCGETLTMPEIQRRCPGVSIPTLQVRLKTAKTWDEMRRPMRLVRRA